MVEKKKERERKRESDRKLLHGKEMAFFMVGSMFQMEPSLMGSIVDSNTYHTMMETLDSPV